MASIIAILLYGVALRHRLGAACDFRIVDVGSDAVVEWMVTARLPFDSLYYDGAERPIHISYGP